METSTAQCRAILVADPRGGLRRISRGFWTPFLAVLAFAGLGGAPALAADSGDGAATLDAVESGQLDCADLDTGDFELVGEYVMGRMVGSAKGHRSMDQLMATMMGGRNAERMHEAMGERFTGCGAGRLPGGYAGMMGAFGMMGAGGVGPGGMMGGGFGSSGGDGAYARPGFGPGGPGGMMGFSRGVDDDDDDVATWMGVAMLVLLAVAVIAVIFIARPRRRAEGGSGSYGPDPVAVLAERFARGEIGSDEYAERRGLLEGGGK